MCIRDSLDTVGVDGGGDDLGGGVGVGAAELAGGDENTFVHAHSHQLTQHALCGRREMCIRDREFCIVGDHRAAQQVAVAADVLGQAVDHHVHAQIQRIGVVGGGKGIVHKNLRAVAVGDLRHLRQIHQHHGGIGGGLYVDDLGVWLDEGLQLLQMIGLEGVVLNAEPDVYKRQGECLFRNAATVD